jgi:hypothetical protein
MVTCAHPPRLRVPHIRGGIRLRAVTSAATLSCGIDLGQLIGKIVRRPRVGLRATLSGLSAED